MAAFGRAWGFFMCFIFLIANFFDTCMYPMLVSEYIATTVNHSLVFSTLFLPGGNTTRRSILFSPSNITSRGCVVCYHELPWSWGCGFYRCYTHRTCFDAYFFHMFCFAALFKCLWVRAYVPCLCIIYYSDGSKRKEPPTGVSWLVWFSGAFQDGKTLETWSNPRRLSQFYDIFVFRLIKCMTLNVPFLSLWLAHFFSCPVR